MPKGSFIGKIIEEKTGVPVLYATVVAYYAKDSSMVNGTISGENGLFTISDLKPGKYFVITTFMGFQRDTIKNLFIKPNNLLVDLGTINLRPAVNTLQGVEIVSEVTYVEYKIDKKVVNVGNDIGSSGGTAVNALENVPSVSVDIDGNVSLRGSSSFIVMINGKPSPLSGTEALEQIPVSAIKNVEIITNPSAKYDPEGMTGIINVVLKETVKSGFTGVVDLNGDNFLSHGVNALFYYRTGKFNTFLGANYRDSRGPGGGFQILDRIIGDSIYSRETEMDRTHLRNGYTIRGGFDFEPNKKNVFTLDGSYNNYSRSNDHTSRIHEFTNFDQTESFRVNELGGGSAGKGFNISTNWVHKFDDKGTELVTLVNYNYDKSDDLDFSEEKLSTSDWVIIDSIFDAMNTHDIETEHDIRVKMDFTKNLKFDNGRLEAGLQAKVNPKYYEVIFNDLDSLGVWQVNPEYSSDLHFNRNVYSAYTTLSGEHKSIGYQFGLRAEHTYQNIYDLEKDYDFVINRLDFFPTVHFSKKFKKDRQLLLSYSRRVERPGGWEMEPIPHKVNSTFIRIGNPELEPQFMDNIELSFQKTIKKSFVSVEAYYHTTQNIITRLRSVDEYGISYLNFENLNRDHRVGLELMANLILLKWFNANLSGNYYYYKLVGDLDQIGDVNAESRNYDVRLRLNFVVTPNTRVQLMGAYTGPSVTAQGQSAPFFMTNASVRQTFLKNKLSLSLSVRDIFGTQKHEFESYGASFYSLDSFYRKSPVFSLELSYKINNYKEEKKKPTEMERGGGDMEM